MFSSTTLEPLHGCAINMDNVTLEILWMMADEGLSPSWSKTSNSSPKSQNNWLQKNTRGLDVFTPAQYIRLSYDSESFLLTHKVLWCRLQWTWFHANDRTHQNASDHLRRSQWGPPPEKLKSIRFLQNCHVKWIQTVLNWAELWFHVGHHVFLGVGTWNCWSRSSSRGPVWSDTRTYWFKADSCGREHVARFWPRWDSFRKNWR